MDLDDEELEATRKLHKRNNESKLEEVIERLTQRIKESSDWKIKPIYLTDDIVAIETVLQAVERLQQENEEIIVKNRAIKRESEAYAEKMIKLNKELEDKNLECIYLAVENEDLKIKNNMRIVGTLAEIELKELIKSDFISKDTIKEKINELKEELSDYNEYTNLNIPETIDVIVLESKINLLEKLIYNN